MRTAYGAKGFGPRHRRTPDTRVRSVVAVGAAVVRAAAPPARRARRGRGRLVRRLSLSDPRLRPEVDDGLAERVGLAVRATRGAVVWPVVRSVVRFEDGRALGAAGAGVDATEAGFGVADGEALARGAGVVDVAGAVGATGSGASSAAVASRATTDPADEVLAELRTAALSAAAEPAARSTPAIDSAVITPARPINCPSTRPTVRDCRHRTQNHYIQEPSQMRPEVRPATAVRARTAPRYPHNGGVRILLVEDDAAVAASSFDGLTALGFEVDHVVTGAAALEAVGVRRIPPRGRAARPRPARTWTARRSAGGSGPSPTSRSSW